MKISEQFDLAADKDAKLSLITSNYSAMVSIAQELRRSAERLTIWATGLMLLLAGWLVTGKLALNISQKSILSLAIILFGVVAILIIRTLQQRYRGVAHVIRRINELQMAHMPGAYFDDEPLFPTDWKNYGTTKWKESIFRISYFSLVVVSLFAAVIIWLV